MDSAVHVSPGVLGGVVEDGEAGDRWEAVQLGQAGADGEDVRDDGAADAGRLGAMGQV